MTAGRYDITCEQGASFIRLIKLYDSSNEPRDLTGYEARMHVRRTKNASSTIIELSTDNGRIIIEPTEDMPLGAIQLVLTAEETSYLTDEGVYDLELIATDNSVERVLQGRFKLDLEVTR